MNKKTDRQFDLLVFDWDGTLFDSISLIARCIQQACRDIGVEVPDVATAKSVIGLELSQAMQRVLDGLQPAQYQQMVECYRRHYFAAQHEVLLYPGAETFLQSCRDRGYMLAIATGKGKRGLDEALKSVDIGHLFDATRTAEETTSKPDPLMLNELMMVLDTPASRTLMIGDTTHDIQMAVNAGVPSVAVSHGAHEVAELSVYTPEDGMLGIVDSIQALGDWLTQNG